MPIEKFKELSKIKGNNDKIKFVKENCNDLEFIKGLRFFCDDSIVTNISSKKLDKSLNIEGCYDIGSVDEFINFISSTTGKDSEVCSVKKFIDKNPDISEILTGLVIKKYPVKFGTKFFNRIFKNNPIKINPYMGCTQYDKEKVDNLFKKNPYLLSQVKNDGQFLNVFINCEGEDFTARSGIKQHIGGKIKKMQEHMSRLYNESFVVIGEVMVKGYDRSTANGIIRGLISSNKKISDGDKKEAAKFFKKYNKSIEEIEELIYMVVWDLVDYDDFIGVEDEDKRMCYRDRIQNAEEFVKHVNLLESIKEVLVMTEQKIVKNFKEAMEHLKEVLISGGEGTVLKSVDDNYFEDGKPNYQIKMKVEFSVDLKVVSINEGKKGSEREGKLGSVTAESNDGKLITGVSGFNESQQEEIWENKEFFIGKIIEVKCNGTSSNKEGGFGLLYANFKGVRDDKTEADSLEDILSAEKAAFNIEKMMGGE